VLKDIVGAAVLGPPDTEIRDHFKAGKLIPNMNSFAPLRHRSSADHLYQELIATYSETCSSARIAE